MTPEVLESFLVTESRWFLSFGESDTELKPACWSAAAGLHPWAQACIGSTPPPGTLRDSWVGAALPHSHFVLWPSPPAAQTWPPPFPLQVLGSSRALSVRRLCCQLSLSSRVPRAQPSDPPPPLRAIPLGITAESATRADGAARFQNEALLLQSITAHTVLRTGNGLCRGDNLNGRGLQGPCVQMRGGSHP